jgi:hypothetical protein
MAARKNPATPAQDKLNAVGIDAICTDVCECVPLRTIARKCGVSFAKLAEYLSRPEHTEQYARAREAQADKMAEDILAIADDGLNDTYTDDDGNERTDHDVVARSRLRVDARKWLASKMAPKKYGDKMAIGGADDLPPVQITEIVRKIVKAD